MNGIAAVGRDHVNDISVYFHWPPYSEILKQSFPELYRYESRFRYLLNRYFTYFAIWQLDLDPSIPTFPRLSPPSTRVPYWIPTHLTAVERLETPLCGLVG